MVRSQYADLLPSFYPASEVVDLSYLRELAAAQRPAAAPVAPTPAAPAQASPRPAPKKG